MAKADEKTITISDAEFGEVEKTLPAAADRAYVRTRLDQIKQAEASAEALRFNVKKSHGSVTSLRACTPRVRSRS